ncbi:MAG: S9 family peptidase, partial [Candidatus Dormibacteraeota bacterium]|nr:S9 family peptidase [Candidatus Dormibacteraeota bacterium]
AERGTAGLYVMRADGGEARPLVVRKRAVAGFTWSPDGRRIAFLAPDEPTDEDDRRERERDDADVYGARRRYQRVRVVDVRTGEATGPVTGEVHVTEVAWSPDGEWLGCIARPSPELDARVDGEIVVLRPDGGELRTVFRGAAAGLSWPVRDRLVFAAGHQPDLSTSGVTVWSTTPRGDRPLVIGTTRDEPRCSFSLDGARVATAVAVRVAEGLATRVELRDPAGGERGRALHESRGALDACDAADDRLALIEAACDRPAEVYAGPHGNLHRLSDHGAHLEGIRFGASEEFRWTAPDGAALDGVLIRPAGATAERLPAVVVPHGGPYGRSVPGLQLGWHAWGTWLAGAGYVALLPNYRGGLGHGHDFARAAAGGVGGVELSDVLSMVDAAVERGIVDPGRLGIAGWSQGGFLAAAAVTQTDRFKAAIVGAGPVEWDMMSVTSDLGRFEAELAGGFPWQETSTRGGAERSPLRHAARVTTPTLILHGEKDERVPVSQAYAFSRALRANGVAVELVTYPREPHGIGELRHQRDVLTRVRGWCDRWLKAE